MSLLEWQLENMKQKLELQEISHRREISTLNEKVSNLAINLEDLYFRLGITKLTVTNELIKQSNAFFTVNL